MGHSVEVKKANTKQEFWGVAKLHLQYIPYGFLSFLGIDFLACMYAFMARDNNAILLVAMDKERVVGFVSGTVDVRSFYRRFIRKNILWGLILLPKLVTWASIKRALETLLYPLKHELGGLPQAELLSIVVDHPYQGKGISTLLYERLKKYFQMSGVREFKIIVGSTLMSAICFYQKMGATKITEIEVHKGCTSWVMLHRIT